MIANAATAAAVVAMQTSSDRRSWDHDSMFQPCVRAVQPAVSARRRREMWIMAYVVALNQQRRLEAARQRASQTVRAPRIRSRCAFFRF